MLLSVREAARLLSVSRRTLQRRIGEGSVPSVRFGGRVLVRLADLQRVVDELAPNLGAKGEP